MGRLLVGAGLILVVAGLPGRNVAIIGGAKISGKIDVIQNPSWLDRRRRSIALAVRRWLTPREPAEV